MPAARRWPIAAVVALASAGCATSPPEPAVRTGDVTGAVWVANETGDSVTVLDAATGDRLATLTGIEAPHNVQSAADGTTIWAVSGADQVLAVDAASLDVTALGSTDEHPAHVVTDADGRVLVTASGQPSLFTYDSRLRPVRRTPLAGAPHGVRLSADGTTAVVANTGAGTVDVVDTGTGAVRATVPVGDSPVQVAVTADGRTAFVSLGGSNEVARVDLVARTVAARVAVPASPAQVLLTAAGHLLVANQGTPEVPGETVSVLDPATLETVAELPTGRGPHGLVADPSGLSAWVTNAAGNSVTQLDLEAMTAVRTVLVGELPGGITFTPTGTRSAGTVALDLPGREDRGAHGGAHDH